MHSFISYDGLPIKAGGAHKLRKRPPKDIYDEFLLFLNRFAVIRKSEITFTFYSSQEKTYKTMPNVWKLTKTFGIPGWDSWNLKTVRQHLWTWKVGSSEVAKALQVLDSFSGFPPNEYGPAVLSFMWKFHFKDLQSGAILQGQELIPQVDERLHNSQIYLRLGQKSTVSTWFAFPFSELQEKEMEYIQQLSNALPFSFSEKHWRLWKKSKSGNWRPGVLTINLHT